MHDPASYLPAAPLLISIVTKMIPAKDDATPLRIRCMIIDDEPPAHTVVAELIRSVPWLELTASCYSAVEAVEKISEIAPELIFLDIVMPELSGFQLLDLIRGHHIHIIVISAHPQYAIEGFDYNVAAYLLKPIPFDRFMGAVMKVRKMIERQASARKIPEPSGPAPDKKSMRSILDDSIWIKSGVKVHSVRYKHIYYIEGLKDYVKVHCKEGVLVSYGNLASISIRLPKDLFVRIHRSYVVNVKAIATIEGNIVTLTNQSRIPLAANKDRDKVYQKLTGHRKGDHADE